VISDVHGNVFALRAVLDAINAASADVVVNLGDLLSGGVAPRETADLLMSTGALTVRGNHERQLLETPREHMGLSDGFAYDSITDEHRGWLASLAPLVHLTPRVLAVHGSPDDDLCYLLETVTEDGVRPATVQEVVERLGDTTDGIDLLLCGHTHLQRHITLPDGTIVVNPGSVGWPAYEDDVPMPHVIEAGTPHARFAVLDNAVGRWEAQFLAIDYPWQQAADLALANNRPDVHHALLTGRMS
jgi:predicted phosphodiesterase